MLVKLIVSKLFITGKSLTPLNHHQDLEDPEFRNLELIKKFEKITEMNRKKQQLTLEVK